ncbi:MAG TPA: hypothetical protein VGB91_09285, partial [Rhizomicrobium sp.]
VDTLSTHAATHGGKPPAHLFTRDTVAKAPLRPGPEPATTTPAAAHPATPPKPPAGVAHDQSPLTPPATTPVPTHAATPATNLPVPANQTTPDLRENRGASPATGTNPDTRRVIRERSGAPTPDAVPAESLHHAGGEPTGPSTAPPTELHAHTPLPGTLAPTHATEPFTRAPRPPAVETPVPPVTHVTRPIETVAPPVRHVERPAETVAPLPPRRAVRPMETVTPPPPRRVERPVETPPAAAAEHPAKKPDKTKPEPQ